MAHFKMKFIDSQFKATRIVISRFDTFTVAEKGYKEDYNNKMIN